MVSQISVHPSHPTPHSPTLPTSYTPHPLLLGTPEGEALIRDTFTWPLNVSLQKAPALCPQIQGKQSHDPTVQGKQSHELLGPTHR